MSSHPTWVRGLKFYICHVNTNAIQVAPHVGAWIEISLPKQPPPPCQVAPHVGAWIEIRRRSGSPGY